ncbi:TonB dependent receptor [compost metagenome]
MDKSPDQDGLSNQSIRTGDIKYLDLNGDGVINGNDMHDIGYSDIPNMIFGFNFNVGYKGFDLTANFQGAKNFQQYIRFDPFNLDANALDMFRDSWTENNRNASLPRLYSGIKQNNAQRSSFWLYDASYLKLRNLEFAYTFSMNPTFKTIGIQSLRVFVGGNNLFQWSKLNDFDAEAPNIDPDRNSYYYPQLKSYTFGLNLTF